ncbi:4Fe-4S binding protein [Robertmurraya massiliosenegalensis]|uniref:4Fe-4S binding protein n=1 Tax=Robertmurraya TaxID=2837507 RepID=UPI0039A5A226
MNKKKIRNLRLASMGGITLLVVIGGVAGWGTGSFSSFGLKTIYAICPLGYLEAALASRTIMPKLLLCFLIIAGLTILLGRIFCGWICPVPLTRKLFRNKIDDPNDVYIGKKHKDNLSERDHTGTDYDMLKQLSANEKTVNIATLKDNIVPKKHRSFGIPILGATLASSAIFGFPVFCLICPIGLIFASLFALTRLFNFNEPTLDLIIFPIILVIELVLLRKWCSKICPLGALLSLFSRLNRRLVPTVDRSRCIEEVHGIECQRCRKACSLDIELKNDIGTGQISSCMKCKECSTSCPVHAISFPWKKTQKNS